MGSYCQGMTSTNEAQGHLITSTTAEVGDRIDLGLGTLVHRVIEIASIERYRTQFGTTVAKCVTTEGENFTLWGAGTIYHRAVGR